MARNRWTSSYSVNYETHKKAPLDARQYTDYKSDLTLQSTWTGNDWNVWAYNWMIVSVMNDGVNNWLYVLNSSTDDYTDINNWIYIGATDDYIEITSQTDVYIDFNNWDDSNGGTSFTDAWKTLDRAFTKPYAVTAILNIHTKWDFTIWWHEVNLLKKSYGRLRFVWSVTELMTNVDTTQVDKFDYSTTTDLWTNDFSWKYIWGIATRWAYMWVPIKSNTANTLKIAHYNLPSNYNIIFENNDTLTFDTSHFEIEAQVYLLNYNIKFINNVIFTAKNRVRPSYSSIDMSGLTYWMRRALWEYYKKQIYNLSWCHIYGVSSYLFYLVWTVVRNSWIEWNWNSRLFYGWEVLWWWWFIIDNVADLVWSSRSWKLHIWRNYWIELNDVKRFWTIAWDTNISLFNYDSEWYVLKVNNVDWLLDLSNYEQGNWVANINMSMNQPISWVFNNWYINHNWYKNFKYVDVANNVSINLAWTYPEYEHNTQVTVADNSTESIKVWDITENMAVVVKFEFTRWSDMWEWEMRIIKNWSNNMTLQQTNLMWVSLSSSLSWNDLMLNITTDNQWTDTVVNYTLERKMVF